MRIFIAGEVASGKSSLLNAIAGGIISSPYNQKGKSSPIIYEFDEIDNASSSLNKIIPILEFDYQNNEVATNMNSKLPINETNQIIFKSHFGLGKFIVYDYHNIDDPSKSMKNDIIHCDVMVFVTSADTAFLHRHEIDAFTKIQKLCQNYSVNLCIVANKFDSESDLNHNQIITQLQSRNYVKNIFRISSHKLLIENILKHQLTIPIADLFQSEFRKILLNANVAMPKNNQLSYLDIDPNQIYNGDWDNFIDFLIKQQNNLSEIRQQSRSKMLSYYLSEISGSDYDDDDPIDLQEYEIFPQIIQIFIESDDIENLNKIFTDVLFKNNFGYIGFISIFVELIDTFHRGDDIDNENQLINKLENQIFGYYSNQRVVPPHMFNLFLYSVASTNYAINVDLLVYLLKDIRLWSKCSTRYWDIAENEKCNIGNRKHSEFKSEHVRKILTHDHFTYRGQSVTSEIHQLVTLSIMSPEELGKLDQEKKLPYNIIKKYLGDLALIRTKMYINYKYQTTIPYLFNDDLIDEINSKNSEYSNARDNMFTIYKLLRCKYQ